MALTAKRREELAAQIDTAASWQSQPGRRGVLKAIAAELRGEELEDSEEQQVAKQSDQDRLKAAEEAEREAQEIKAGRRGAKPAP